MRRMAETSGTELTSVSSTERSRWTIPLALIAGALVVLLGIYAETATTVIYQWNNSTAYNYGYLIIPISAYLIWIERNAVAKWTPSASPVGLAVIAAFAFAWFVADLMGIDEGRHFALAGMMQGVFLTLLGWRLYRRLAFPLLYLVLMVPTAAFLVPTLQKLSHFVAVEMLRLSGMSVYAEGILIQVPSGSFLVEPGCAGLNFLLASIALALLYGKLTYKTAAKRWACLIIAIFSSIIANFLRVYLIVAITEWTNRKINIADDHLMYGWIFFGIIMMIMMHWGMRFQDAEAGHAAPQNERPVAGPSYSVGAKAALAAIALAICVAPVLGSRATASASGSDAERVTMPATIDGWMYQDPSPGWAPEMTEGGQKAAGSYARGGQTVDVAVIHYQAQHEGHEAAAAENKPAGDNWALSGVRTREVELAGAGTKAVGSALLRFGASSRAALWWYESSGCITTSRLEAKLCAMRARIAGSPSRGSYVVVSAAYSENPAGAFETLGAFARSFRVDELVASNAGRP